MKKILQSFLLGAFLFSSLSEAGSLSQDDFNQVIDRVESFYFYNRHQEKIEVQRFWETQGEHDCAIRFPYLTLERPVVKITGAVAQYAGMSLDAFAILVCHEFGHHLADGPRIGSGHFVSWSSAEGEADYWATAECLKHYLRDQESPVDLNEFSLPADAAEKCQKNFPKSDERETCYRSVHAILALKSYFEESGSKIDLERHAPKTVGLVRRFRRDLYRDQCRIETFLAGAYCNQKDASCDSGDGARPDCWYTYDQ
jgi:hypothetical protein